MVYKYLINTLFAISLVVFSSVGHAVQVDGDVDYEVTIDQVFTYNSLSNGDVILYTTVTNNYGANLSCSKGVYMKASDVGMERTLSAVLAARVANIKVHLQANKDPAKRWPGDNNICHLIGLKL